MTGSYSALLTVLAIALGAAASLMLALPAYPALEGDLLAATSPAALIEVS